MASFNKVCEQCIDNCKQPFYMTLVQCPYFYAKPRKKKDPLALREPIKSKSTDLSAQSKGITIGVVKNV